MVIKLLMSCKRPLSALTSLNFRLLQQKFEKLPKTLKNAAFWAQKLQPYQELHQTKHLRSFQTRLRVPNETQCPLGATCLSRFKDEKSNGSDEKSVKRKIAKKNQQD